MPKYALVVTADMRFIPGVNGMLNALKYYGCDDIEFHLVHTFPAKDGYIEKAQAIFPNLRPTYVPTFIEEHGIPMPASGRPSKSLMKYCRWWYPAMCLQNYDAIAIFDADRQIVNNLRPYFEITAKSDMILVAKNDYSEAEWDSYDARRAMTKQPPIYSNPFFAKPRTVKDMFMRIPEHSVEHATGDMHPVNALLLEMELIKQVLILPCVFWVFVDVQNVRLARREINGKYYIGLHPLGDLLFTFHRRYWGIRMCMRMANGKQPWQKINGMNNVDIFWWFTHYFNTELYLKIDWKWGEYTGQQGDWRGKQGIKRK